VRLWRQGHRLLPILDSPTQAGYIAVLSNTTPTVYAHRGTMSMGFGKIAFVLVELVADPKGDSLVAHIENYLIVEGI
jgi:hypothetical protein